MATTKQNVLAKLRAIARARTEQEYMEKVSSLKESDEWKSSSNFRNYIAKTWLPQHKVTRIRTQICPPRALNYFSKKCYWFFSRYFSQFLQKWVWAFRKDRFLTTINTNNGVERQNKAFKYDYLEGHKHLTLSSMLSVLLEEFLPDKYLKYGVVIETHIKSLESVCVWVGVEMGGGGEEG